MDDFDAIRPYRDDEVPAVVARLIEDPDFCHAAALFFLPRLTAGFPALGHVLAGRHLRRKAANLDSVRDVQTLMSHYMDAVIEKTVFDFTVDGLERLVPGRACFRGWSGDLRHARIRWCRGVREHRGAQREL